MCRTDTVIGYLDTGARPYRVVAGMRKDARSGVQFDRTNLPWRMLAKKRMHACVNTHSGNDGARSARSAPLQATGEALLTDFANGILEVSAIPAALQRQLTFDCMSRSLPRKT
jgi:hypothetical protein